MRTLVKVANLELRSAPEGKPVPHHPPGDGCGLAYEIGNGGEPIGPVPKITRGGDSSIVTGPALLRPDEREGASSDHHQGLSNVRQGALQGKEDAKNARAKILMTR